MNTQPPFPSAPANLRLPRRPAPAASPEPSSQAQWEYATDLASLQEREANLREYEERLRAWQQQLDATRMPMPPRLTAAPFASASPFLSGEGMDVRAGWEKLHRARALLEAEQNQVRDDRMVLRDLKKSLEDREAAVSAREAAVAERERQFAAASVNTPAEADATTLSAVRRLTSGPLQAAKSVFGRGK